MQTLSQSNARRGSDGHMESEVDQLLRVNVITAVSGTTSKTTSAKADLRKRRQKQNQGRPSSSTPITSNDVTTIIMTPLPVFYVKVSPDFRSSSPPALKTIHINLPLRLHHRIVVTADHLLLPPRTRCLRNAIKTTKNHIAPRTTRATNLQWAAIIIMPIIIVSITIITVTCSQRVALARRCGQSLFWAPQINERHSNTTVWLEIIISAMRRRHRRHLLSRPWKALDCPSLRFEGRIGVGRRIWTRMSVVRRSSPLRPSTPTPMLLLSASSIL